MHAHTPLAHTPHTHHTGLVLTSPLLTPAQKLHYIIKNNFNRPACIQTIQGTPGEFLELIKSQRSSPGIRATKSCQSKLYYRALNLLLIIYYYCCCCCCCCYHYYYIFLIWVPPNIESVWYSISSKNIITIMECKHYLIQRWIYTFKKRRILISYPLKSGGVREEELVPQTTPYC